MINKTAEMLKELQLKGIQNCLNIQLDYINENKIGFLEGLNSLLEKEIIYREESKANTNIKVAHFPYLKELKDFDFKYNETINEMQIKDLATLRFIEENKNILFLGPPGVGKTHLATAIGIEAAKKRNSVYFINCHDLINNLNKAYKENRLESALKFYRKYKVLIIDEVGYLPISTNEANMFFQLIAKRYEYKSTIITTNKSFGKWGEIFGDDMIANAILDRLVHHSVIFNIKGKSYRIKDLMI